MKRYLILTLGVAGSLIGRPAAARNPIVDEGLADPSVKVFGGRAYIYGTRDFSVANPAWIAKEWRVYSSSDLVTWLDSGVALDDDAIAWRAHADRDWAPDAIFYGNQYYFYFPLGDDVSGVADLIGVAAGSSPAGPFTDILGRALVDNSTAPARAIDPMVFADADGARYLLWGNRSLYIAALNDDMKSFRTTPQGVVIANAPAYEEGPFVWIHGGKYYLLYSRCGAGCYDSLDYAVGDAVGGPYTYRGTVIAHGRRGNAHGSVFEFNGQWYVAYHEPAPTTYYRKTKLEFIHYNNGGDIPQVEPTACGVGRTDGRKVIEAENYFDKSPGVGYEDSTDEGHGFDVTGIVADSWLKFQNVDLPSGADSFQARVSAGAGRGRIEIHLGDATGALIGTCDVPAGDQTWQTVKTKLDNPIAGVHDVFLVFKGEGQDLFKLNWFQFSGRAGGCGCALDAGSPPVQVPIALLLTGLIARRRPEGCRKRVPNQTWERALDHPKKAIYAKLTVAVQITARGGGGPVRRWSDSFVGGFSGGE